MTRRLVRIQPAATRDLDHHAAFIAEDSVEVAIRFLAAAEQTANFLADSPLIGVACDGFFNSPAAKDVRIWRIKGFPNHQILYRSIESELLVIRVIHAAQDKKQFFR